MKVSACVQFFRKRAKKGQKRTKYLKFWQKCTKFELNYLKKKGQMTVFGNCNKLLE